MNTRISTIAIFSTLVISFGLGGCLTKEEAPSFTGTDTPADTGNGGNGGAGSGSTGNSAPTISGSPSSLVLVDQYYSFTPSATDPDGDDLTFSIIQKPDWATFDPSTGTLAGTPSAANVGITAGIQISVTDGEATSNLSLFALEVTQVALGSTTLSWSPPTENVDGSMLTNLSGYKLYYGQSSGSYTNVIQIDNPTVTVYLVDNLVPDTYYFAATAFNVAGTESAFSGEAVIQVN